MGTVKDDLGMHMNYTDSREHNLVADRNNRTINDLIRFNFYSLTFRMTPNIMVIKLTTIATKHLNWSPVKGGVSTYHRPYFIMRGLSLNL